MVMVMDKQTESRKQFEEWFRSKHEGQMITKGSGYSDPITQLMWQAWQASRASIAVELPDWHDPYENWMEETRNTLRSIGLSIKGE